MDQVEEGVVGIITNHRFTSNPTFRGMRQSLMKSFDQIYILDLHGSNKPKELAPDGSPDENVFDIEQGVAISFFIKKQGLEKKIYHSDLYGKREEKYDFCIQNNIETLNWKEINPESPFYLFSQAAENDNNIYDKGWTLREIFLNFSSGIQTSRDGFVTSQEKKVLQNRMIDFFNLEIKDNEIREKFSINDYRAFKIDTIRKERKFDTDKILKYHYRPFDNRYIYYDKGIVQEWQFPIQKHMLSRNIGLIIGRAGQNVNQAVDWNLAYITDNIIDLNLFYRGGTQLIPLYLYETGSDLFSDGENVKTENFTEKFRNFINEKYDNPTGEEIVYYIYAILFSPTYRKKYRSALDIDFPKVIFTDDLEIFKKLSVLGKELSEVHLQKAKISEKNFPFGSYKGKGENKVIFRKFVLNEKVNNLGKIYINDTQFFDEVPQEVWNFHIGGYQVLDKFLKDRKDRILNLEEIENIEKIIKSIEFTRSKMLEIDEISKNWL